MTEQSPSLEFNHALVSPDFNAGNFVMYLSKNPQGFSIQTDQSLSRKDTGSPLPLTVAQRLRLKGGMVDEMRFTGGNDAKKAQNALRTATPENKNTAQEEYEKARIKYVTEGNKAKVAIRNVRRNGDNLVVIVRPVSYPVFSEFSNFEASDELLNFSEATATSMIIKTADNKFILQHRSEDNALYGDVPGASIAGMLDGKFRQGKDRGTLEPIDEESILYNIKREASEEMGIDENDFTSITLVGLAEETSPQVHHEFLYTADTHLTSEEIKRKALETTRARKKELKAEDIEEKFEFIEAAPEAIFDLLTKVACPIPPTHSAAFAATGYNLVMTTSGQEAAQDYKKRLEQGIKDNYDEINARIKRTYINNPELLTHIPLRLARRAERIAASFRVKNPQDDETTAFKQALSSLPQRNPNAYTPSYLPEEQGLPDMESELRRIGLI